MKEVELGRYAGPFESIPFETFIQSPIGLVPKAGNKTRLIFHLSFDFEQSGHQSVNHHTPREKCTVKYPDIDYVIQLSFLWGGATRQVFYAKTDVQTAFHLAPLKKSCWRWLIMMAQHPITKVTYYFVDKCLPFGASISCSHFQRISNGIKHIVE